MEGIEKGAQVNSITGVKGGAETKYRTGNVNLTAANVGAAEENHDQEGTGKCDGDGYADRCPGARLCYFGDRSGGRCYSFL